MNPSWCLLLVIAFCVGLSSAAILEKNSVHFKNSLSPNDILKVCCVSADDDFGCHLVKNGQTLDFSFNDSILKTKIDCYLGHGPTYLHSRTFRAYESGGLIVHYGKQNFWDARDDGIYFTHGTEAPKLEYKWT
ncbi:hypothetical protein AALP_AA7G232300 [Arabis alpina]|uniref:S-protein homolog n=1 Tax=Arabis alpina TaxID=50452 RepID=A0A087GK09_ARAAL|nr:hypothetical protein AALP_AA7G232300 [Arabis alpina]